MPIGTGDLVRMSADKPKYVHIQYPRNVYSWILPNEVGARAKTPINPMKEKQHQSASRFKRGILAARTSMMHKMNTVAVNQKTPIKTSAIIPIIPPIPSTLPRVISHSTSDNCACARDKAHKRRYEAVCEIQPKQNSMVWMT